MKNIKILLVIFVSAFLLNAIWEWLHSVLYVSYQGGAITFAILLRAALFDAAVTAAFAYPFLRYEKLKNSRWLFVLLLTAFAIGLEEWALATNRLAYAEAMPIIPFLDIGLTPAIQLGLLGYISFFIASRS